MPLNWGFWVKVINKEERKMDIGTVIIIQLAFIGIMVVIGIFLKIKEKRQERNRRVEYIKKNCPHLSKAFFGKDND